MDHEPVDAMGPAERLGSRRDITGGDARPDVRRADGHLILADERNAEGGESEARSQFLEQGDAAGRLVTETEVLADHDTSGVQPLDDHIVHERLRGNRRHGRRERQHEEHIGAERADQLGAPPKRGQQRGMVPLSDDRGRMRIEGHHDDREPELTTPLDRRPDEGLVSPMDAVEDPDREHTTTPAGRDLIQPSPMLDHRIAFLSPTGHRTARPMARPW